MSDDRLIDIEIKIARLEDLVETLNQTAYRQQRKTEELEALCSALARRIKDMATADSERTPGNEKPPHY